MSTEFSNDISKTIILRNTSPNSPQTKRFEPRFRKSGNELNERNAPPASAGRA